MKRKIEKIGLFFIGLSGFFCINSVTLMSIFLIFTLIIFLITVDKGKIEKIKRNTFFIPFLLLLFYFLFQIIISNDKINALKYTKGWWTIIYLLIIPLFIDDKKKRNLLFIFYLGGVFLGIIWGFYKYFTYYINSEYRLKGFGVGILPFALFMGYGILIFAYFLTKKNNCLLLIPITLTSLVINFSRSIGAFLSIFPALIFFMLGKDKKEKIFQIFLCFIILTLSFLSVKQSVNKGISYLETEKITNARVRRLYWEYSIYCFKKYPVLGAKTGDFWANIEEFIKNSRLNKWEVIHMQKVPDKKFHPHNFYIDTLGRMGIIGFALIFILIGTFLYESLRYFKKDKERSLILLSFLAYILFYSLTEDPFFKSDMAFPLYYIFGSHIGYDNN